MPLIQLDAPPRCNWRCWHFLVGSLALHAVFLGLGELDFVHEPEMRFFSSEDSISVCIVASGQAQNLKDIDDLAQRPEMASVHEVEKTSPVVPAPRKAVRKKQASPKKVTSSPQPEEAETTSQAAKDVVATAGDEPASNHGAAVERTIGEGDAPSFARFFPPEYPHQARARNMEGRVLLRVLIDTEGRAKDIEVLESSHPAFTKAARKSAQRSRYIPLMHHGRPEDAWVLIPFQFKLK